ncbi:hypothetical protein Droror1_Dr00024363 [Drosera rotundifolia]
MLNLPSTLVLVFSTQRPRTALEALQSLHSPSFWIRFSEFLRVYILLTLFQPSRLPSALEAFFNFLMVRKVDMLDGVTITRSEKVKDELILDGNDIELCSEL